MGFIVKTGFILHKISKNMLVSELVPIIVNNYPVKIICSNHSSSAGCIKLCNNSTPALQIFIEFFKTINLRVIKISQNSSLTSITYEKALCWSFHDEHSKRFFKNEFRRPSWTPSCITQNAQGLQVNFYQIQNQHPQITLDL